MVDGDDSGWLGVQMSMGEWNGLWWVWCKRCIGW